MEAEACIISFLETLGILETLGVPQVKAAYQTLGTPQVKLSYYLHHSVLLVCLGCLGYSFPAWIYTIERAQDQFQYP